LSQNQKDSKVQVLVNTNLKVSKKRRNLTNIKIKDKKDSFIKILSIYQQQFLDQMHTILTMLSQTLKNKGMIINIGLKSIANRSKKIEKEI